MFLLVPAHPGCPGQIPQSRKTVVLCVCCAALPSFPVPAGGARKSADDRESLEHQENVSKIKGSQARNVMMQNMMRRSEVCHPNVRLYLIVDCIILSIMNNCYQLLW